MSTHRPPTFPQNVFPAWETPRLATRVAQGVEGFHGEVAQQ